MSEKKPTRTFPTSEATRDPIFLFQKRCWHIMDVPPGWTFEDGALYNDDNPDDAVASYEETRERFPELVFEWWETETVFFTRGEGERYGKRHHYRWPDGWRVYCVPAEGDMAKILAEHTERGVSA